MESRNPFGLSDIALDDLRHRRLEDNEIDFSDIPELTEEQFAQMRPFKEVLAEIEANNS